MNNKSVAEVLRKLREYLKFSFEIIDPQTHYDEDPDLDRYLLDPKGFQRDSGQVLAIQSKTLLGKIIGALGKCLPRLKKNS